MTIAVLGAGGTMGLAMARNLARAGYSVRAWNRTRSKAEPLAADGAELCDSATAALEGADVVLTMLPDAGAVLDTMSEALSARDGDRQLIWLQMSTIGEDGQDRCAELAADRGVTLFDAPVSGTKQPAEEGELVVLGSGPREHRERVQPIFDVVGHKTVWAGESGAGTRLKLAVNAWLVSVVEGAAETLALAGGLGLDPGLVLSVVDGGPLDSGYLQTKGAAMLAGDFAPPAFTLALAAKDAGLVETAAEAHGLDLPLLRTIRERLDQGAAEHGDKDLSATFLTSAPRQG